jgi:ABC-2 type transport system permease protein/lipopolysaccharide transport system permease protein
MAGHGGGDAVIDTALIGDAPPRKLARVRQRPSFIRSVAFVFASRRQIWALTMRDFRARYKQTALGLGWALLLPFLTVAVFGLFVQRFAHANTQGVPYAVWSLLGLTAWNFFANSFNAGGQSLLVNQSLVNKVYSARQIYPIASVLLAAVDGIIAFGALTIVAIVTRFVPAVTAYWLPVVVAVNVTFVVAATMLAAILLVYVRDLRNVVPFILQLGLFATPVVYGLDQISSSYRLLYCFLNPMAPIIESYRQVLLYGGNPPWTYLGAGAATSIALLILAAWVFERLERGIADII